MDDELRRDLERWFTYHPPTGDQPARYERLRSAARVLAAAIADECPAGADRDAAVRKLREAVMTANAAIACEDK